MMLFLEFLLAFWGKKTNKKRYIHPSIRWWISLFTKTLTQQTEIQRASTGVLHLLGVCLIYGLQLAKSFLAALCNSLRSGFGPEVHFQQERSDGVGNQAICCARLHLIRNGFICFASSLVHPALDPFNPARCNSARSLIKATSPAMDLMALFEIHVTILTWSCIVN